MEIKIGNDLMIVLAEAVEHSRITFQGRMVGLIQRLELSAVVGNRDTRRRVVFGRGRHIEPDYEAVDAMRMAGFQVEMIDIDECNWDL